MINDNAINVIKKILNPIIKLKAMKKVTSKVKVGLL